MTRNRSTKFSHALLLLVMILLDFWLARAIVLVDLVGMEVVGVARFRRMSKTHIGISDMRKDPTLFGAAMVR